MGCGAYSKPKVMKDKWYPDYVKTLPKMTGKVVAITGCTTGTGYCLAKLCKELGATVVMLNRQSERATKALEDVSGVQGEGSVDLIPCDLQSIQSVRDCVKALTQKYGEAGIDVLCNNAGVMALKDQATGDGYCVQMQTNHLSHFILTAGAMPLLTKAANERGEARIVNHSSIAREEEAKKGGKLEKKFMEKTEGGKLGGDGMVAR